MKIAQIRRLLPRRRFIQLSGLAALCSALGIPVSVVYADVPMKTNRVILSGSNWLGGKGVDIYSNDGNYSSNSNDLEYVNIGTANAPKNVLSGYRWQCVELVNRLYLTNGWITANWLGDADTLYNNVPTGLTKVADGSIDSVNAGDVICLGGGPLIGGTQYGHVVIVDNVNGTTINVRSQNLSSTSDTTLSTFTWDTTNKKIVLGTGWSSFWTVGIVHAPGSSTPPPPIIALKTSRSPDGTAIEVYAATNGRVTQHWYHDGGNSGTADIIDQANIVGIDKINQADGTESLYTAVPDGVYESWWNASSGGVHTSKIVYPGLSGITLSGVRGVIAELTTESGVTVHHLYILASDGPYEAYWKDGGDGVHLSHLINIPGPIAFTHSIGPDGSEQLYVAVPTWVYEVAWIPGSGVIRMHNIINITQGDIKSVDKGALLPDGSQLLYTTTSTTVWQTYWATDGGPYYNGTIATSQVNAFQGLKVVTPDGVHHVYLATPDHVQEYWWLGANSGGGEIIRISQSNITAIAQQLDGTTQLLFTAAGSNVWESWWDSTRGPTNFILFGVTA